MKRTIAMMGAILVLLLLASGFMAADNIRLSGEKAALTDKFNDQSYEYALLHHQLQASRQQVTDLIQERDQLVRELQDYQPGREPGGSGRVIPAESLPEEPPHNPTAPDSLAKGDSVPDDAPAGEKDDIASTGGAASDSGDDSDGKDADGSADGSVGENSDGSAGEAARDLAGDTADLDADISADGSVDGSADGSADGSVGGNGDGSAGGAARDLAGDTADLNADISADGSADGPDDGSVGENSDGSTGGAARDLTGDTADLNADISADGSVDGPDDGSVGENSDGSAGEAARDLAGHNSSSLDFPGEDAPVIPANTDAVSAPVTVSGGATQAALSNMAGASILPEDNIFVIQTDAPLQPSSETTSNIAASSDAAGEDVHLQLQQLQQEVSSLRQELEQLRTRLLLLHQPLSLTPAETSPAPAEDTLYQLDSLLRSIPSTLRLKYWNNILLTP